MQSLILRRCLAEGLAASEIGVACDSDLTHWFSHSTMASSLQSYGARAAKHQNPAAQALLITMDRKKTNLCVSIDVTTKSAFLAIVDAVGPYVCLIKACFSHPRSHWPDGLTRPIRRTSM